MKKQEYEEILSKLFLKLRRIFLRRVTDNKLERRDNYVRKKFKAEPEPE
jgi:hypothetical protein